LPSVCPQGRARPLRQVPHRLSTNQSNRTAYLQGALILAGAAMMSRLLGAVYRIPLARLLGSYGIGLYGAGYSIYVTLLSVATVGINVAISKLVAEKLASGDERAAHRVFVISLFLLAAFGLVAAVALAIWAMPLALATQNNPDAYYAIIALSPAILLAALEGSFRGYFQGYQRMFHPAASQVIEQFFRVASLLILAWVLLPRGEAIAAGGAAFGASIGGAFGLTYLLWAYWGANRDFRDRVARLPEEGYSRERSGAVVRRIFSLAIPISIAGVIIPVMSLVDLFIVPTRLQAIGYSVVRSTELFGQLTQMAGALINLPTVVSYGIQASLVPAISEAQALGDDSGLRSKTAAGLRVTLLIALPAAVGLWLLARPISGLLYAVPEAGIPLSALSFGTLFLMLQQSSSGVLQGLGRTDIPVRNLVAGALVKTALAWVLTGVPWLNIRGAAYSTVVGFALASFLNVYAVYRMVGFGFDPKSMFLKPGVAAAAMGAVVYAGFPPLEALLGSNLAALATVALGGLAYGLVLLLVGGVRERDFSLIPGVGPRLWRVLERMRLTRG